MEQLYEVENSHYYSFVYKVQTGNFPCQKLKIKIDLSKAHDKYSKVSVFSEKDLRWNTLIEDGFRINATSTTSTTTSSTIGSNTTASGGMYGASGLNNSNNSNMMNGGFGSSSSGSNLVGINGVSKEQKVQQFLDNIAKLLFA